MQEYSFVLSVTLESGSHILSPVGSSVKILSPCPSLCLFLLLPPLHYFEMGSHFVTQAVLELMGNPLALDSQFWNYRRK